MDSLEKITVLRLAKLRLKPTRAPAQDEELR
jgi:hypothetical protein